MKNIFLFVIPVAVFVLFVDLCAGKEEFSFLSCKPNIVFVVVDDLGWNDVQWRPGSTCRYSTPNIQKLAGQGMVFTDAYAACPVCSPTRASLLTGKSPAALRLTAHIPMNPGYVSRCIPKDASVLPAETINELPLEEVTFAELLKEDGYDIGYFGKWHLAGAGAFVNRELEGSVSPEFHPEHQGFDINVGGCAYGLPPSYFSPYTNATIQNGPKGEYLTDRLTDEAISFINSRSEAPFLVYLNYYSVHVPLQPKPELLRRCAVYGQEASYAAMIAGVDENIGRLMDVLNREGLSSNTIVLLTSDNGGLFGNDPLRGNKGEIWEGGVRVPLLVRWDGVVRAGSVCSEPVISYDFLPTLLDASGSKQQLPAQVEGVSMLPLWKENNEFIRSDPLFWHYPHYHHGHGPMASSLREGKWKFVYFFETKEMCLFDLEMDLSEKQDLSDKFPEKTLELKARLFQRLNAVNAAMPVSANRDQKAVAVESE